MVTGGEHLNALFRAFRLRNANLDEHKKYTNSITYKDLVPALDSGSERDLALKITSIGRTAVNDKWDQQIYALQAQVAELGKRPTVEQLTQLQTKISELSTSMEAAQKKAADLEADKISSIETGNRFIQWIGSLFKSN